MSNPNSGSASTTPSPQEQLAQEIQSLQSDIGSLQSKVYLSSIHDEIEDLETRLKSMPQRIKLLRERGYPFERELENQANDMVTRWPDVWQRVKTQIDQQAVQLQSDLRKAEMEMSRLSGMAGNVTAARPLAASLRSQVSSLESKVSACENTLRGMYDQFAGDNHTLADHLEKIEWMLQQLEEASFKLLPTEAGVMAVEAVWAQDGKEDKNDPHGNLYLTDQRLIFEQKQEIATKKFLFITTETQKVQKLLFEVPVALIQEIKASKQGLFKNEDHIDLLMRSGAPYPTAHFHLDGQDCNEWQGLINNVQSGEFTRTRAVAVDQEAVEKVKAAPTVCPACNATIQQAVLRGMDTITCEYCGHVIRL